jgi:hypothetical protein
MLSTKADSDTKWKYKLSPGTLATGHYSYDYQFQFQLID